VPDNLKSGVRSPDLYEPDLNPTYADLARHYGAAVIPARVRRPRDKAKVEQGVLLAERWILAALRHHTFFSLAEVKAAVKPLLEKLNGRPMRKLGKSRRQLFEELDKPALKALPSQPYEFASWARPKVAPDYHVEFDDAFYSVPFGLIGEKLDVRGTATTVEVLFNNRRVASHIRSFRPGHYSTKAEHMPEAHQAYVEWTPARLIEWAKKTGPATAALVEEVMRRRAHPQQGFRACFGIMGLAKRYEGRLEAACARALRLKACSYKSVLNILRNNLDRLPPEENAQQTLPLHGNIRGPSYYH
jgi:transposase